MTIYAPSFYKESEADFIPKRREISDVSNSSNAEITTTEDHEYSIGQKVRLHVDDRHGMQINGVEATILTIPTSTTFTTDFDSSLLEAYSTPVYVDGDGFTPSHVVPITGTTQNSATR